MCHEYILHTKRHIYTHICIHIYINSHTFVPMWLYIPPDLPGILSFCKNHRRKWKVAFGKNGYTVCSAGQEGKNPSMICNFTFHHAPQQLWSIMSLELKIHQEECLIYATCSQPKHVSKHTKVYPSKYVSELVVCGFSVSSIHASPK